MDNILIQGQTVKLRIKATDLSEQDLTLLNSYDVYIGIYNEKHKQAFLCSTSDGSLEKEVGEDYISYTASFSTKFLKGFYFLETLVKDSSGSYVAVCNDSIKIFVEPRNIAKVL